MVWNAVFIVTGVLWLVGCARTLAALRSSRALPPAPDDVSGSRPSVTIVIAARDEADRIVETVKRVLAQRGVDLAVTVVDDRSSDGTGDVVKAAFRTDPCVRVVRIDSLPEGWLGKCHALHSGAAGIADGWLLFMDADARLRFFARRSPCAPRWRCSGWRSCAARWKSTPGEEAPTSGSARSTWFARRRTETLAGTSPFAWRCSTT